MFIYLNQFLNGLNASYAQTLSILFYVHVNTRRTPEPDMGTIFYKKNQWNILVIGNYYVNYQNVMLLTSSDTKQTLMHLFLFSNSAQRELVDRCIQGYNARKVRCSCVYSAYILKPRRYRIEGGGDRVSVHFAVTFLDCWRTSFCVTKITKAADLM